MDDDDDDYTVYNEDDEDNTHEDDEAYYQRRYYRRNLSDLDLTDYVRNLAYLEDDISLPSLHQADINDINQWDGEWSEHSEENHWRNRDAVYYEQFSHLMRFIDRWTQRVYHTIIDQGNYENLRRVFQTMARSFIRALYLGERGDFNPQYELLYLDLREIALGNQSEFSVQELEEPGILQELGTFPYGYYTIPEFSDQEWDEIRNDPDLNLELLWLERILATPDLAFVLELFIELIQDDVFFPEENSEWILEIRSHHILEPGITPHRYLYDIIPSLPEPHVAIMEIIQLINIQLPVSATIIRRYLEDNCPWMHFQRNREEGPGN
jgi:hypothetical protein